ncbi:MAG: hypothetical protein M3370_03585 [Actinomycetota bacterium]|nr:hypothetical protein [Actinomycetota bacterium]
MAWSLTGGGGPEAEAEGEGEGTTVSALTRGAAHEATLEDRPQGLVEVTGVVRALEADDEDILGGDMAVRRGSPVVVAREVPVRPAEQAAGR